MTVGENKILIEKYPFLRIRNAWTGELDDTYEFTWLDDMPKGWRKCFGLKMCDDILAALQESGMNPEDYQIVQIKEKFGSLRWYDNGAPQQVQDVIIKYEYLSSHVCINCGKVNVPLYGGWISPYCDYCAQRFYANPEECIIAQANLESSFMVTKYAENEKNEIKFDISDILDRIGYEVKI